MREIRQYWIYRLALPAAVLAIAIIGGVGFFISKIVVDSQVRGLQSTGRTLALMAVDPILLRDRIELVKRVATVGSKENLNIVVLDTSGQTMTEFPANRIGKSSPSKRPPLEFKIVASTGQNLGKILLIDENPQFDLDDSVVFIGFLVLLLGYLVYFSVKGSQPILRDIVRLSDWTEGSETSRESFKFKEVADTFEKIEAQSKRLVQNERDQVAARIALQLAHDIRSPLTGLELTLKAVPNVPQNLKSVIEATIKSVQGIADSILTKTPHLRGNPSNANTFASEDSECELVDIVSEASLAVSEATYQHMASSLIEIRFETHVAQAFVKLHKLNFKRSLFNLVKNSVEAIGENPGEIVVSVSLQNDEVLIEVSDSGPGIQKALVSKLGVEGATFGKPQGKGMGLSFVKSAVESLGGSLEVTSDSGTGAKVFLKLPTVDIEIFEPKKIDGLSETRVLTNSNSFRPEFITTMESLAEAVEFLSRSNSRVFVEMSFTEGELDAIDVAEILEGSQLLIADSIPWSKFERSKVIGSKIFWLEALTTDAAIAEVTHKQYVLIDDDLGVRNSWLMVAERDHVILRTFPSFEDFSKVCKHLPSNTPIYVDFHLEGGVTGDIVSQKVVDLGFGGVHIATSANPFDLPSMPWVRSIRGKDVPWESKLLRTKTS